MKKYSIIALMVLFAVSFWNCEKDDLCAETTPTTPRVVIQFYNNVAPTELKPVTDLVIKEFGTDNKLVSNEAATDDARYLFNTSTVSVPLRTDAFETKFNFILNNGGTGEATDVLTFTYTKKDTYISRACGYKTTFEITNPTTISTTNWIQSVTVENVKIENEDETHIKIYF
ncbi:MULTISPECIES: DUF6452 family protein [Flavobacterium]|uniref:DUF6452 family protein n=1 Tax=Flavobacterium jumunjinense TaxID=998845 RepID=A0ABV5GHV3_9FLAO|nr:MULTISPECIES: DUF6452 family protein [Flavobacterium]